MLALRQFNTQSLKLVTQARALTGLGRSPLLKLELAAGAFSFTDAHKFLTPQQRTDVRRSRGNSE
jgi:hypothetical protein